MKFYLVDWDTTSHQAQQGVSTSTSKDVKVDVRTVMEGLIPLTDAALSCVIVYGSAQAIVTHK
ncbi:hypothetical protein N7507_007179 [Penicillium longicatenatum]|nr:hypothetical protein N7507_007179 [Penicillium longicatenatum]